MFLVLWLAWLSIRFVLGFVNEHQTVRDGPLLTVEQWATLATAGLGVVVLMIAAARSASVSE